MGVVIGVVRGPVMAVAGEDRYEDEPSDRTGERDVLRWAGMRWAGAFRAMAVDMLGFG